MGNFGGRCLIGMRSTLSNILCFNLEHSCQDDVAEMVHTRDGSRVVREFLAHGTAKVG